MFKRWFGARRRHPEPAAVRPIAPPRPATAPPADTALDRLRPLYLQLLLGGEGDDSAPLSVPEKLVGQMVEQQVRDGELRGTAVPRLPTIIPLLLKQLRDPNASARDYVAIIKQDPVVAAAVLKVADSVYFNPYRKPLDNFERAVGALGIEGLRLVLSTAVLQPILQGRGDTLPQRVWDHSLACAVCCQQLAEREGVDSFKAYLCGLVHDIGMVTLYNQVQLQSRQYLDGQRPGSALLAQLLAQWSRPLAYWIAQDWQLPADIVRALGAQGERLPAPPPMARILERANHLCEAFLLQRAGRLEEEELARIAAALDFPDNIIAQMESVSVESIGRRS